MLLSHAMPAWHLEDDRIVFFKPVLHQPMSMGTPIARGLQQSEASTLPRWIACKNHLAGNHREAGRESESSASQAR